MGCLVWADYRHHRLQLSPHAAPGPKAAPGPDGASTSVQVSSSCRTCDIQRGTARRRQLADILGAPICESHLADSFGGLTGSLATFGEDAVGKTWCVAFLLGWISSGTVRHCQALGGRCLHAKGRPLCTKHITQGEHIVQILAILGHWEPRPRLHIGPEG